MKAKHLKLFKVKMLFTSTLLDWFLSAFCLRKLHCFTWKCLTLILECNLLMNRLHSFEESGFNLAYVVPRSENTEKFKTGLLICHCIGSGSKAILLKNTSQSRSASTLQERTQIAQFFCGIYFFEGPKRNITSLIQRSITIVA